MKRSALFQGQKVTFPMVAELPVMWGYTGNPHQANRYKALVDTETGKLFAIASRDYRLIRHEEAIERVEAAIYETDNLGGYETSTEFYNHGARMRRTYRFTNISCEIQSGDLVNPELLLFNSYDATWPFILLLGAFRVVCTNGLVVGEKFLHLRKRHIVDLDQMNLREQVASALKRFEMQTEEWKKWAGRQLTEDIYDQVLEGLGFGKRAKAEIENRVRKEADDFRDDGFGILSVWIFFNILTWYITHKAVSLNHRVEMEKRLRAAMSYPRGDASRNVD